MNERDNWHTDMGTQADTYIEKRFEEECEFLANGDSILNEWRREKSSIYHIQIRLYLIISTLVGMMSLIH